MCQEYRSIVYSAATIGARACSTTQAYFAYLESLREAARQFDCTIYAYVLMTNHAHLLERGRTGARFQP